MDIFNSKEYEWSDITAIVAGRPVTKIRAISYVKKQEKEALYAKGNKPHSIQRGNKSYETSLTLLQSELEAIEAASGGDVLDASFNVVVSYGNPSKGDVIKTDLIEGNEITEVPKGMNQGDKFSEHELPGIALNIKNNYV
ncbi:MULTISPECIES: hypothetical protein [Bacteroidaceae]|jgi:hypothetical protein|uniref:hypothetical protein n=1 Tax=Bacteroidaceae TaxID=815 RepID=UPI002063E670|nr:MULTISPECIES: hypothetical protein [Bacteroidaceae]DAL14310.1 MAG TPA_asm: putative XkdM-like protein [Caudoviricetes sp.]DAV44031.1 MAG TPA: putative XkdM-like protein [Caudoviricetes sp.]